MKKVLIKVKSVKGFCTANNKVGDTWVIDDNIYVPQNLCMHAFYVLYPWIQTMRMGGEIPWSENNEIEVPCIDTENMVIFSLKQE
ncbi:MAG: TIGR04076 family protein [Caldisericia bacterium]